MVKSKFKAGIAVLVACGVVAASPVLAAGATRSAQMLPLLGASVGSVPYATGVESTWRCVAVTDEALKLDKKPVNVDAAGRVVVDSKGAPYSCRSPVGNYQAEVAGLGILEVLAGVGGFVALTVIAVENTDSAG